MYTTKREAVLQAVAHQSSSCVPYCIHLTGEGYKAYGEQLMRDYPNAEVEQDLREGRISFNQAVNLCIGNFMIPTLHPWWDWDYDNFSDAYKDPYDVPTSPAPILRRDTPQALEKFMENTRYISEKYHTYMCTLIFGSHWEKAYFTRGIENFLADIAGEPEFAAMLLQFIVDTNMQILPKLLQCPQVDGVLLGSDWGTQRDLIMSPKDWHTLLEAGEKRQYDCIHAAGKQVMIHSCGCILRILPDLVRMGVDILNPVQPECMDLSLLKDRYGSSLTYWGGISTQQVLPKGTPQQVCEETARTIEQMSRGGGYITCSSQEIQTDVPYENLRALIDTAKSYT